MSEILVPCMLSRVQLCATPWTVAHQAPLSMGFSRQEYWSGLTFPPPGDLLDPEDEPLSPALAGRFFTTEPPGNPAITTAEHKSWINNQTLSSLGADLVC